MKIEWCTFFFITKYFLRQFIFVHAGILKPRVFLDKTTIKKSFHTLHVILQYISHEVLQRAKKLQIVCSHAGTTRRLAPCRSIKDIYQHNEPSCENKH